MSQTRLPPGTLPRDMTIQARIDAAYRDRDAIFREYPFLEEEDLQQALRYAAASMNEEQVDLNRVA